MRDEARVLKDLDSVHERMNDLAPPSTDPFPPNGEIPTTGLTRKALAEYNDLLEAEAVLVIERREILRATGFPEPHGERDRAQQTLRDLRRG